LLTKNNPINGYILGSEVATYTAENLPDFLKTMDEFKGDNLKDCLMNGFLQFDQQLISEEVITKLREMAGLNDTQANDSEIDALRQEAEMPIHELMSKLREVCAALFLYIFS
jgi:hypothetical protein